jgi:tRNA-uridine 2-sulfurtransferase
MASFSDDNTKLSGSAPVPARVVVAMSGGVDSSVVAALLLEQGWEVIGVTLQLYDHGEATGRKGSCCAGQDIHDARRVADRLGIAHYVLDYERRFRSIVMQGFADSYAAGETPIPCVNCNSQIKFGELLNTARNLGAVALATGHFVQNRTGRCGPELLRATDAERDQSYFLFATTRAQLRSLIFPLGRMTKPEVRALARRFRLPVSEKPDSQDICFVPQGRYTSVIERLRPGALESGNIVDTGGRILGRHHGIVNFTVGQRRGLGISSPRPLYVIYIDPARREVVVGPRESLRTYSITLRNVNWLGDAPLVEAAQNGLSVYVRVRSNQPLRSATLFTEHSGVRVMLEEGEYAVAAGQACVFYADKSPDARVLGGGWIARSPNLAKAAVIVPGSTREMLLGPGRSATTPVKDKSSGSISLEGVVQS